MNFLTKGIFLSLASFIVLFSPVEAIGVSNEDNILLLTKSQIVSLENSQKDNTDAILTIIKDNSKQTIYRETYL